MTLLRFEFVYQIVVFENTRPLDFLHKEMAGIIGVATDNKSLQKQSITTEVTLIDRSTPYTLTVDITPNDLIIQTNEWNSFVNTHKNNYSCSEFSKRLIDELRLLKPQSATVRLVNKEDSQDMVHLIYSFKEQKDSPVPKKKRAI